MDAFKRHIRGFRHSGRSCPCCRETNIDDSRKLARRRLQRETATEIDERLIVLSDELFDEPRDTK